MSSLRSRAIAAAKKRDGLRSRLIFWRKRGKRAKKLRKSYIRAAVEARRLKRQLEAERRKTLGDKAYDKARRYVGTMEVGANNRGPVVDKLIREGGGIPGQAWCGWFVAAMYKRAGAKAVDWRWGAVRLLRGIAGLQVVKEPKRGDLVRFNFDHVGMYVKDDGEAIITLEGNTGATGAVSDSASGGDGVYVKRRNKSLVRDYLRVTK